MAKGIRFVQLSSNQRPRIAAIAIVSRYSATAPPLQDGAGDAAAFVVAALNAFGFCARGLGGLEDGLGDRCSSASGTVAVVKTLGRSAGHFGRGWFEMKMGGFGVDLQFRWVNNYLAWGLLRFDNCNRRLLTEVASETNEAESWVVKVWS
jgi:hypothetical protein